MSSAIQEPGDVEGAGSGDLATLKATKVTFADDAIVLRVSPKPVFSVTVRATDAEGISVPNVTVSTGNMMGEFWSGRAADAAEW